MTQSLDLIGGSPVMCSEGQCGVLGRIIVEPSTKSVTHLAVEPKGLFGAFGRLVPVDRVTSAGKEVQLSCTRSEYEAFDPDESAQSVSQDLEVSLLAGDAGLGMGALPITHLVLHEIPEGEIEVSSKENIHGTDGPAGHLRGLSVDTNGYRITHLLLKVGHLLGKKDVSIPIENVTKIDSEGVTLALSKEQVANFS